MTVPTQVFCSLLGAALFRQRVELPGEVDWDAVYDEAEAQAVQGLFYGLLPELPLTKELRTRWNRSCLATIAGGMRLGAAQEELCRLLEDNGIAAVILKGTSAAVYYPEPSLRTMGDIDFLVREEDYIRTCELLGHSGYMHASHTGESYRHESFVKDDCWFECHRSFAYRHWAEARRIDEAIQKGISGAAEYRLPSAENGLVLITHAAQHLDSGLGMRQIIDWMMFVHAVLDDRAWEGECGELIRSCGFGKLAVTVTGLCRMYLGLPDEITWCDTADEDICAQLLALVLSYGNFGGKAPVEHRVEALMHHSRQGFFRYLREAGESNWELLHRQPWLRPLAPVYQIGRYARQALTTKGALSDMTDRVKKTKSKEELLERLGL